MFVWFNIVSNTWEQERQAIRKCMEVCLMIAANAWLYLMRTTISWIFSPCLRKASVLCFSVYSLYFLFFVFKFFMCSSPCELPVHCLVISGGVDDAIFSNTVFAHVLEQKNKLTQNPQKGVTQHHVGYRSHARVFAVLQLSGFYDTFLFCLFF